MGVKTKRPRIAGTTKTRPQLVCSAEVALRRNPNLFATVVVYDPNKEQNQERKQAKVAMAKEEKFATVWDAICAEAKSL